MRISDWSSDVCSSDLILMLLRENCLRHALLTERVGEGTICCYRICSFLIFWGETGMTCAKWLCLTLPFLIAACDGAANPQPDANSSEIQASEPSEEGASMDQRVRDAVLARLRDPDSAKFRNVRKEIGRAHV